MYSKYISNDILSALSFISRAKSTKESYAYLNLWTNSQ